MAMFLGPNWIEAATRSGARADDSPGWTPYENSHSHWYKNRPGHHEHEDHAGTVKRFAHGGDGRRHIRRARNRVGLDRRTAFIPSRTSHEARNEAIARL